MCVCREKDSNREGCKEGRSIGVGNGGKEGRVEVSVVAR